jgi:osmotically inducible lipoprotein OsmB
MRRLVLLLALIALVGTGCAGLTAQEKGSLAGGAGGAAGGALIGAAAGSAAIGAAIGGPVGLIGGYLLGDYFFTSDKGWTKEP